MTEIISFGTAMLAHKQGKTVQYFDETWSDYGDTWSDYGDTCVYSVYLCNRLKWRIKPEPVKYSVDVWLDRVPEIGISYDFFEYVCGMGAHWNKKSVRDCNKHYKLTVESVE